MYENDFTKIPEEVEEDVSVLEIEYGLPVVESSTDSYKIKLKDRDQRFQSANLTYGIEGDLEQITVVPNIGKSFSDAVEYEEEIEDLLEE